MVACTDIQLRAFNRHNCNTHFWSWNYHSCWHQTCRLQILVKGFKMYSLQLWSLRRVLYFIFYYFSELGVSKLCACCLPCCCLLSIHAYARGSMTVSVLLTILRKLGREKVWKKIVNTLKKRTVWWKVKWGREANLCLKETSVVRSSFAWTCSESNIYYSSLSLIRRGSNYCLKISIYLEDFLYFPYSGDRHSVRHTVSTLLVNHELPFIFLPVNTNLSLLVVADKS